MIRMTSISKPLYVVVSGLIDHLVRLRPRPATDEEIRSTFDAEGGSVGPVDEMLYGRSASVTDPAPVCTVRWSPFSMPRRFAHFRRVDLYAT